MLWNHCHSCVLHHHLQVHKILTDMEELYTIGGHYSMNRVNQQSQQQQLGLYNPHPIPLDSFNDIQKAQLLLKPSWLVQLRERKQQNKLHVIIPSKQEVYLHCKHTHKTFKVFNIITGTHLKPSARDDITSKLHPMCFLPKSIIIQNKQNPLLIRSTH